MLEQEDRLDSGGILVPMGLDYFNSVIVNHVSSHVLSQSLSRCAFVSGINICRFEITREKCTINHPQEISTLMVPSTHHMHMLAQNGPSNVVFCTVMAALVGPLITSTHHMTHVNSFF